MTYEEIEKLSPVKIIYGSHFTTGTYYSYMLPHEANMKPYIEIKADLCLANKTIELLHEIGHAIHHAKNCKCIQNMDDHTLAEYHAYKFTMKHIKGNKKLVEVFAADIFAAINSTQHIYKTAAKRIIKLKSYAKLI